MGRPKNVPSKVVKAKPDSEFTFETGTSRYCPGFFENHRAELLKDGFDSNDWLPGGKHFDCIANKSVDKDAPALFPRDLSPAMGPPACPRFKSPSSSSIRAFDASPCGVGDGSRVLTAVTLPTPSCPPPSLPNSSSPSFSPSSSVCSSTPPLHPSPPFVSPSPSRKFDSDLSALENGSVLSCLDLDLAAFVIETFDEAQRQELLRRGGFTDWLRLKLKKPLRSNGGPNLGLNADSLMALHTRPKFPTHGSNVLEPHSENLVTPTEEAPSLPADTDVGAAATVGFLPAATPGGQDIESTRVANQEKNRGPTSASAVAAVPAPAHPRDKMQAKLLPRVQEWSESADRALFEFLPPELSAPLLSHETQPGYLVRRSQQQLEVARRRHDLQKESNDAAVAAKPASWLRRESSSGFYGVDRDPGGPPGKWRAFIDVNEDDRHLIAYYDHAITAAHSYDDLATRIGAPVNFFGIDEADALAAAAEAKAPDPCAWQAPLPASASSRATLISSSAPGTPALPASSSQSVSAPSAASRGTPTTSSSSSAQSAPTLAPRRVISSNGGTKTTSTKHGVSYHKRKEKFVMVLTVPGLKKFYITFDTEDEAADEYDRLVRLHGLTNKPLNTMSEAEKAAGRGDVKKTSIYKGVTFNKCKQKWAAQVRIGGKKKFFGSHDTEVEAAKAFDKGVSHLLDKELNFPEDYPFRQGSVLPTLSRGVAVSEEEARSRAMSVANDPARVGGGLLALFGNGSGHDGHKEGATVGSILGGGGERYVGGGDGFVGVGDSELSDLTANAASFLSGGGSSTKRKPPRDRSVMPPPRHSHTSSGCRSKSRGGNSSVARARNASRQVKRSNSNRGADSSDDEDESSESDSTEHLSEYEKLRQANIAKNQAELARLGLIPNPPASKRARNVKGDVALGSSSSSSEEEDEEDSSSSDDDEDTYENLRKRNIARNAAVLASLGLDQITANFSERATTKPSSAQHPSSSSSSSGSSVSASFSSSSSSPSSSTAPEVREADVLSSSGKWACCMCTFVNRPSVAFCSLCNTPWQAPATLVPAEPVFPLPVPRGFRVVGQDEDGIWCFEMESASNVNDPPDYQCLKAEAVDLNGFESAIEEDVSEGKEHIAAVSALSGDCCSVDGLSGSSSLDRIRGFVGVGDGFVIEELAVDVDAVDGFEIAAYGSAF